MKIFLGIFLGAWALTSTAVAASSGGSGAADALFDPDVTSKAQQAAPPANLRINTLFPTPVMLVRPALLDFGVVVTNTSATNTFLIENAGRDRLVGKATVQPPFEIIEGGSYALKRNEAQVVTIVYRPRKYTGTNDVQGVTFTGAGEAVPTVVGTPAIAPPTRLRSR